MSGSGGGGGDGSGDGVVPLVREFGGGNLPKGHLGVSIYLGPSLGEVRNINHTSQMPVSSLSSIPSQKSSYPARRRSVGMGRDQDARSEWLGTGIGRY